MKEPRITVTCTAELLAALIAADSALRRSRSGGSQTHAQHLSPLTVQMVSARSALPAQPNGPLTTGTKVEPGEPDHG